MRAVRMLAMLLLFGVAVPAGVARAEEPGAIQRTGAAVERGAQRTGAHIERRARQTGAALQRAGTWTERKVRRGAARIGIGGGS